MYSVIPFNLSNKICLYFCYNCVHLFYILYSAWLILLSRIWQKVSSMFSGFLPHPPKNAVRRTGYTVCPLSVHELVNVCASWPEFNLCPTQCVYLLLRQYSQIGFRNTLINCLLKHADRHQCASHQPFLWYLWRWISYLDSVIRKTVSL